MDPNKFHQFLIERSRILEDIESFLIMICRYMLKMVNGGCGASAVSENVRSLIKSLSLIHGLYGYPASTSTANNVTVNKEAVKEMLLNEIIVEGKMFVNFCESAKRKEFWEFESDFRTENSNPNNFLREPAYMFLQMVRDLFKGFDGTQAAIIGRRYLESLPDKNYLKPVVWAQHNNQPAYGVSVGVRSFVRPIYLYMKLSQLKDVNHGLNGSSLRDVEAFQCVDRRTLIRRQECKRSKFDMSKEPCKSCQIFFDHYDPSIEDIFVNSFVCSTPFGNCAEYDVIQTNKLPWILDYHAPAWKLFESACQWHLQAFENLTRDLGEQDLFNLHELIKTYHDSIDGKILVYELNAERFDFNLNATSWLTEKIRKKNRRKTTS